MQNKDPEVSENESDNRPPLFSGQVNYYGDGDGYFPAGAFFIPQSESFK